MVKLSYAEIRPSSEIIYMNIYIGGLMKNNITMVIATRNKGKLAEIKQLLKGFPVNLKSLADFGPIPEVKEDGTTFDDNAYKKASQTARILGIPALADDSGLLVDALDGAPGVFSARFAGEDATDAQNCKKLLKKMEGTTNRKAAFECVISIAVPGGAALTYEARCEGLIMKKTIGSNGFGYDPLFYYPPLEKTFAQLLQNEKSNVSHRGKALKEVKNEFDKILIWLEQNVPVDEKFQPKGE